MRASYHRSFRPPLDAGQMTTPSPRGILPDTMIKHGCEHTRRHRSRAQEDQLDTLQNQLQGRSVLRAVTLNESVGFNQ